MEKNNADFIDMTTGTLSETGTNDCPDVVKKYAAGLNGKKEGKKNDGVQ